MASSVECKDHVDAADETNLQAVQALSRDLAVKPGQFHKNEPSTVKYIGARYTRTSH